MKQARFNSTAHHSYWLVIQIFRDAVFFNVAFLTGFGACPTVMLRNHFRNNAAKTLHLKISELPICNHSSTSKQVPFDQIPSYHVVYPRQMTKD